MKIAAEAKLDGKYLLSTSALDLSAEDVTLDYKNLLEAEGGFRAPLEAEMTTQPQAGDELAGVDSSSARSDPVRVVAAGHAPPPSGPAGPLHTSRVDSLG